MGTRLLTAAVLLTIIALAAGTAPAQDRCIDYADYPLIETQLAIPGLTYGMASAGDYLYIAAHDRGLQVVDLSDPAAPVKISSWNSPGESYGVAVADGLAYLADGSLGLQIIDISNPSAPVFLGGVDTLGMIRNVTVSGNLAFLAAGWGSGGLIVIDVTDPTQPVQIGQAPAAGDARDVAVIGDQAYVVDYGGFIFTYDVADPANVQQVGVVPTAGPALALGVANDIMAVACSYSGVQVFQPNQPGTPQAVGIVEVLDHFGSYPTNVSVRDVQVVGDQAYVVSSHYLGAVLDLSDPTNPGVNTYIPLPADAERVAADEFYFFAALGDDGVEILQQGDMDLPAPVGTHPSVQNFTSGPFAIRSDWAYVAGTHLEIVDIGYHLLPVHQNSVYPGSEIYGVTISGNFLYLLVDQYNAIKVYSLANPTSPVQIHQYFTAGGTPKCLVSFGDYLYSGPHNGYLGISDISDPYTADIMTYANPIPSSSQIMVIADGRLYVGGQYQVVILDLADPTDPQLVDTLTFPSLVQGITVMGDRAYVSTANHGLDIVDLADPEYPVLGHFPATNLVHVSVHDGIAYLSDRETGLLVVDISDETEPRFLGLKHGGSFETRIMGEHLLVAGSGYIGGMEYMPLQCNGISPAPDIPARDRPLTAYPNPFNPMTNFSFALEQDQTVRLGVFDLRGNRVRVLVPGENLPAGNHLITWDGRDEQGRLLGSGTYIGRLQTESQASTHRVILLK